MQRWLLVHQTYALVCYRLDVENAVIAFIHEHQDITILEIETAYASVRVCKSVCKSVCVCVCKDWVWVSTGIQDVGAYESR